MSNAILGVVFLAATVVLVATFGWTAVLRSSRSEVSSQAIVVSSSTVDSRGADIAVGNIGSPIDGLIVHIPPAAIDPTERAPVSITVGYDVRSVPVRAGKASGIVVSLRADTVEQFNGPVTIEVHYNTSPHPTLAIPYNVDAKGNLHLLNIKTFDAAKNTLVFYTLRPGDFTWIYAN